MDLLRSGIVYAFFRKLLNQLYPFFHLNPLSVKVCLLKSDNKQKTEVKKLLLFGYFFSHSIYLKHEKRGANMLLLIV